MNFRRGAMCGLTHRKRSPLPFRADNRKEGFQMKIGVKHPVYAAYSVSGTTESYSGGTLLGKAIKIDINPNTTDVVEYADDAIAEEAHEFTEGDLSLDTSDVSDTNYASLMGHTTDSESGEIIAKDTDEPIKVGFGFYARKVVNGVSAWRAIWLPVCVFTEPTESMETRKKDLVFGSHTLPGKIRTNLAGEWKREKTFSTEAAAEAWVDAKAGISSGTGGN